MVAISLYRGNLHRTPDVPRRWLMPNPKISLKDFKTLLARRSKALSRLQATTNTNTATTSTNPNPNPNPSPNTNALSDAQNRSLEDKSEPAKVSNNGEGPSSKGKEEEKDWREPEGMELAGGSSPKKLLGGSDTFVDLKNDGLEKASEAADGGAVAVKKQSDPITDNVDQLDEEHEKRKKEVEDKLQVLNAKKHGLVLLLKQILGAEEELKRQHSMQVATMRGPSGPLHADGTIDSGSMTRLMGPRLGSEGNLVGDVDGGEADDVNHNMHSRHMLRTSSMSPSSESPLRRTPSVHQNMVSHPSRASLGATGSPSRFALSGHQGNPTNLPTVSVSGTSYIASSTSPAASGGTSVFRDARQPSPWK